MRLRWHEIRSVEPATGAAASTPRPAVAITARSGVRLVLVPCARPGGGLLPAGAAQVHALADLVARTVGEPGSGRLARE